MEDGVSTRRHLREQVAEEVRALLARRQMNGAKLAAAIGRSEMYVSRRLRAETAFDLDDLQRIAEVLGVAPLDLLPRTVGTPNAHYPSVARSSDPHRPATPASRPTGPKPGGSTRPVSAIPASRRRPAPTRPGNRPMAA